ncbi:transcription initiation factor IIB [Thermococcus sp. SY098]|uniref:Transcription initiation factor IIB n=1 Tax=Thermococcus barophilus (strain DSM 11836 / MP) TaxID=391623 RepID=F0LMU6_THEBM|nr:MULTISPECIES: transcription initiation factor IIB [Thermococcus]ADT84075.1 transcription initiation factor B [Thermococcus barophilus MP]WRS53220.1 transcription initiation factor IIB [Thermococcus sp. SY098]
MEKRRVCPVCGSTEFIYDPEHGEIVCSKCGFVIEENIVDMGPEWRAFDASQREKRSRTGAPESILLHDKGLSTDIGSDRNITGLMREKMYRLRKWQSRLRVSDAAERNLAFALSELDRIASQLKLPKHVEEEAARLYREAVRRGLIRGRSIESVIAACVYAACRLLKIPRTLDEIADIARVDKKEIGRSFRFIARNLNLTPKKLFVKPTDYVNKFADELGLSEKVRRRAIELLEEAYNRGLTSGKSPAGLVAAALYIASLLEGEKRTQREVAEVARVTEVTVRNRYKELVEKLGLKITL